MTTGNVRMHAGILCLLVGLFDPPAVSGGQRTGAFVRQSPLPPPTVMDATVVRQRRVEVASPATLLDPVESRVVTLDLFPDLQLRAVRKDSAPVPGGVTWIGELEGYAESSVVLAAVTGEVVGHIQAPFGYFTLRRGSDGAYLVQQIDPGAAPPRPDDSLSADDAAAPASERDTHVRIQARIDTGSTIDIMAVVTRDAVVGFGSEETARATVQVAIAETNEALRNSGVASTLRLVHIEVVDHAESKNSSLELRRLQNPSDGVLDSVHVLRDTYAADLVVLVLESFDTNVGGQAYINGLASTGAYGFSVVRRSAVDEERAFAHEIGHNMGAAHDWYVAATPGAFSYAKGFTSIAGRLLDVMSYWDQCRETHTSCAQVLLYSSPRTSHQNVAMGVPVGTSTACQERVRPEVDCDADAAAALTRMAPVVAGFRNSRLALSFRQLRAGESLRSANGRYRLTYQPDGNLVLVDTLDGRLLWATETGGTTPGEAVMQPDGDLVVTDGSGAVRWSSGTGRNPNAYFLVQDDGVLAVFRSDGQLLWDSHVGRVTPPPVAPGLDSLSIASITPTRGSVVTAGQTVQLIATVGYTFASSDVGQLLLHVEDSSGQTVPPVTVNGTGPDRVSIAGGTGEVTLRQSVIVPASGATSLRVFALLYPANLGVYSAFTSVTLSIQ